MMESEQFPYFEFVNCGSYDQDSEPMDGLDDFGDDCSNPLMCEPVHYQQQEFSMHGLNAGNLTTEIKREDEPRPADTNLQRPLKEEPANFENDLEEPIYPNHVVENGFQIVSAERLSGERDLQNYTDQQSSSQYEKSNMEIINPLLNEPNLRSQIQKTGKSRRANYNTILHDRPDKIYSVEEVEALKPFISSTLPGLEDNILMCRICSGRFHSESILLRHLKTEHHLAKPYSCPYETCGYKAARNEHVRLHLLRTHSNIRPIECSLCPYRSLLKAEMLEHIKNRHTPGKEFKCDRCRFDCATRDELIAHVTSAHLNLKSLLKESEAVAPSSKESRTPSLESRTLAGDVLAASYCVNSGSNSQASRENPYDRLSTQMTWNSTRVDSSHYSLSIQNEREGWNGSNIQVSLDSSNDSNHQVKKESSHDDSGVHAAEDLTSMTQLFGVVSQGCSSDFLSVQTKQEDLDGSIIQAISADSSNGSNFDVKKKSWHYESGVQTTTEDLTTAIQPTRNNSRHNSSNGVSIQTKIEDLDGSSVSMTPEDFNNRTIFQFERERRESPSKKVIYESGWLSNVARCSSSGGFVTSREDSAQSKHVEASHTHNRGDKREALSTCRRCDYNTPSPKMLRRRVVKHLDSISGKKCIECFRCPERFTTWASLGYHMITVHGISAESCDCRLCPAQFDSLQSAVIHRRNVHGLKNPYLCEYCDYHTCREPTLKRHVTSKHSDNGKPFKCDRCWFETTESKELTVHYTSTHLKHLLVTSES